MASSGLQQRASAARLRLAEAEQRAKDAAEVNAIENARARAERVMDVLSDALSARIHLVAEGVAVTLLTDARRKEAAEGRRTLRSAASAFFDPEVQLTKRLNGEAVQKGLKQAESVCAALKRALNDAVNAERMRLRPSELDKPIPNIPGKDSLVVKLNNLKRTLDASVAEVRPGDLPETLRQLRSAAESWVHIRLALEAEINRYPAEIRAFVEAASTEDGASWSLLTPTVRFWLDAEDRGDEYKVRRW